MQFQVKQFQQLYFITGEVIFPLEMCFLTDSIYKLLIPHLYFLHQTVFIKGKIRNTGLPVNDVPSRKYLLMDPFQESDNDK